MNYEAMATIRVERRLRPLRLAFLVDPKSRSDVARAIEINSCLWGGRYNTIVPRYRKRFPTQRGALAASIAVKGFLDRFEPDYVVDLYGDADSFFEKQRVLAADDVMPKAATGRVRKGINMLSVYQHQWNHEYQYVRRTPADAVLPMVQRRGPSLALSAAFGTFSEDTEVYRAGFREVYQPNEDAISPGNLFSKMRCLTASKATCAGLRTYGRHLGGPALFLMHGNAPADVLDFWNLRALGWLLAPLPLEWLSELKDSARLLLEHELKQYEGYASAHSRPLLLGARSVRRDDFHRASGLLAAGLTKPVHVAPMYPALWELGRDSDHTERCTVSAVEDEVSVMLEGAPGHRYFSLSPLIAPFASEAARGDDPTWANVLTLSSSENYPLVATVLPPFADRSIRFGVPGDARIVDEGIVVDCHDSFRGLLPAPDPVSVAHAWFGQYQFTPRTSPAGRIALAMSKALGGTLGSRTIAHPELLRQLNAMSHGLVDLAAPSGSLDKPEQQQPTRARVQTRSQLLGLLTRLNRGDSEIAQRHLSNLVDAGVFRIGLTVSCPECTQSSWHALEQIQEKLRCDRCLVEFPFPTANPPRAEAWTYRTQGPFSGDNYANGAYTVLLTIGMLTHWESWSDAMWIPSTELLDPTGKKLEFDFALWRRERHQPRAVLALGECKTFGNFLKRDFLRAKQLATAFSGVVLIFATLKPQINNGERRAFKALAGYRTRNPDGRLTTTPIVILTAREILDPWGPPSCWKGDAKASAAIAICRSRPDLHSLAAATQLVHLGKRPEWFEG